MKTRKKEGQKKKTQKGSVKLLAAIGGALALLFVVVLFDFNIAALKESPFSLRERVFSQSAEQLKRVSSEAKSVKKEVIGGCRTAPDFVNVNRLMQNVSNFENFDEVLASLKFVNGQVFYPEVELNGELVASMRDFFNTVHVFSEDDLNHCVLVLQRARQYSLAKISFNSPKVSARPLNAG